jgi:hypothetical protein
LNKLIESYNYSKATYHLAIYFVDKILKKQNDLKFDLVAIGCMILAVKFIENDPALPSYSEFYNPMKERYQPSEIYDIERKCLHLLDYKLNLLTPFTVLEFFLTNGLILHVDDIVNEFYKKCYEGMKYFTEDIRGLDFTPLEIACASILSAAQEVGFSQKIKKVFKNVYKIDISSFYNTFIVIRNILPENYIQNYSNFQLYNSEEQTNSINLVNFSQRKRTQQNTYCYKELLINESYNTVFKPPKLSSNSINISNSGNLQQKQEYSRSAYFLNNALKCKPKNLSDDSPKISTTSTEEEPNDNFREFCPEDFTFSNFLVSSFNAKNNYLSYNNIY